MKSMKTLVAIGVATASFAVPATAELDVSVGVASQYLFRGVDQGAGDAQVFGDITVSAAGFYASAWMSSTGSVGEEVDLIAGWGGELGSFGVDLGVVNYYYSNGADDTIGALSEIYLGLSWHNLEFYYFDQKAGQHVAYDDNQYYSLGYTAGPFSLLVGMADREEPAGQTYDSDYTHVDLSYAFNDNLTFTVSKITSLDDELNANVSSSAATAKYDDDTQFVVSYSLPIK